MRNGIDFSSWQGVVSTLLGIVVFSFVAVGIRLLLMHNVQQRRERQNRQINERLKTLIAAYKTLGGSFTGDLAVDPAHLRQIRERGKTEDAGHPAQASRLAVEMPAPGNATLPFPSSGSDRSRRIRDAVEASLADIMLLGTEAQVELAVQAANDMVAGRPIETAALVVSLRTFIRHVLDLAPVPVHLTIPKQGPIRAGGGTARGGNGGGGKSGGGGGGGGGGVDTHHAQDAAVTDSAAMHSSLP